jgi:HAD superfamily hydrolase (TIGR01509 family)
VDELLPDRYRAVVFDMDGLLLDTERLWHEAEIELFRRHGEEYTMEDRLAVMGTTAEITASYFSHRLRLAPEEGIALVAELTEIMRGSLTRHVRGQPGAIELVERLRGRVPLALASNSPRDIVQTALAAAGVADAFDAVVTSDDVAHGKPAPDIYLLACQRLGVSPADSLALEDTTSGIAAAKAAGLACFAVPQFAESDVSEADRVIDSLEELLAEV